MALHLNGVAPLVLLAECELAAVVGHLDELG